MLPFLKTKSATQLFSILLLVLCFSTSSCKKDKANPAAFTYNGKWTVAYNFTTGSMVKGTFTATLKADGKWDYVEGSFSKTDAGTWTSSGNSVNFVFNFSGLAAIPAQKLPITV